MPTVKVITAATRLAVDVVGLWDYVQKASTEDEADAVMKIGAAQQIVEQYLGRRTMTQTLDLGYRPVDLIGSVWALPLPPVQSVTSISLITWDGTVTVVNAATYYANVNAEPARIVFREAPSLGDCRPEHGVVIRAVHGYASVAAVPANIREAIYKVAAQMMINRVVRQQAMDSGAPPIGTFKFITSAIQSLLAPSRVYGL